MLKAIIFDMDGVLVDSEMVHYYANKQTMKTHFGIDISYEYYKQFVGGTVNNMWNIIINDFGLFDETVEHLNDLTNEVLLKLTDKTGYPEVPGVTRFVREMKERGIRMAVASSSAMPRIKKNLENLRISDYFEVLVSGEEVGKSKPDPAVFLKTAKKLGVLPKECIVIEDSKNGVLAAYNGGFPCLGFINKNSGNQDLSKASALFEDFRGLDFTFVNMVYCHAVGEPAIVIETERLILREASVDDVERMYELYKDREITEYMPNLFENIEEEREYTRKYIENVYNFYMYGMWIVVLKETGEIIGRVGIEYRHESETADIGTKYSHELGYMIGKDYQRKGYAYEAVKAVIEYAINELEVDDIFAEVNKENIASYNLAIKAGLEENKSIGINKKGYVVLEYKTN